MHYTSPDVYEFISKQTSDPIVERKVCRISSTKFPIYQSDLEFYKKVSPTFAGVTFEVPTPTLCPEERARRRLSWRNERKLYKRTCDATQTQIISMYRPDSSYTVYDTEHRWGDNWNGQDYGIDIDMSKTFTEQYDALLKNTPVMSLAGGNNENSPYINLVADCKNCYLLIESSHCEDCYHSYWLQKCLYCVDSSFSHGCEHCYEIDNCEHCHNLQYSRDCKDCSDSRLLQNCTNCQHCFGCVNLVNAQYMIFNTSVTQEEWDKFIATFYTKQDVLWLQYQQKFTDLVASYPSQTMKLKNTEGTYGHYLRYCENCLFCVDGYEAQDCKYGEHVWRNVKDAMDVSTVGRDSERMYELINTAISAHNCLFSAVSRNCHDIMYCYNCMYCHDCFGCVSLKNQQYCIFNKQYTKEDYEKEVTKIITHMQATGERGEFFDSRISPFSYNDSSAIEQYPVTKDEALDQGLQRNDEEVAINLPDNATTVQATDLPSLISEVEDDIAMKIILCEDTGKPYRIIKQELAFYRKHNISLPRKHPDVRHQARVDKRKGGTMYLRTCDNTGEEMVSVYPQDVEFPVWSEEAYSKEVCG